MATPAPQQNGRGIQNVRASTSDERFTDRTEGRLARVPFLKGGKSTRGKFAANDPQYEQRSERGQEINEEMFREQEEMKESENEAEMNSSNQIIQQRNIKRKKQKATALNKKTLPLLGTTAKWMVFCAVCISYIFQLLFGLLSLLVAVSGEIVSSSFLGSIVDLFTDVSSGFESAGIGLWGISALIVFLTFICVWAWYRFSGFNPFETIMSMFITLVLLSMSLLPLMNLFPWLVLWVVYLNASLLFIKR